MRVFDGFPTWPAAREQLSGQLPATTLAVLDDAVELAVTCHGDQRRPAGEPYIEHLLETVEVLVTGVDVTDTDTLTAAVLHDVVEDTPCTLDRVRQRFGSGVADLVALVTKPEPGPDDDPDEVRRRYLRSFSAAPHAALLVKLADRLSNVQRLHTHPRPDKQRSYYRETVEHFLPLARREPWFHAWFTGWREAMAFLQ